MDIKNKAIKTIYLSIFGNGLLALIKGLAGVFGNSYALIADAIESTVDVFSSLLVWIGLRYANRPADKNHPYGHGKIEPLLTFVVIAFLVTSATIIAYESIQNIRTPHKVPKPWTLIVLGIIIVWKELLYRVISKKSKALNSTVLNADAWHHRADAITSLLAFIGIAIAVVLGEGYETADDWAALLASAVIIYNSYLLFRPAIGEVMDEHRYDDLLIEIHDKSKEVSGIMATEKCYIRKVGSLFFIDLHAQVNSSLSVKEGHYIAHNLKDYLIDKLPNIGDVLVHIEPFKQDD